MPTSAQCQILAQEIIGLANAIEIAALNHTWPEIPAAASEVVSKTLKMLDMIEGVDPSMVMVARQSIHDKMIAWHRKHNPAAAERIEDQRSGRVRREKVVKKEVKK